MNGIVLRSINNIYTVRDVETKKLYICRIKGKYLDDSNGEFNPLVVGDVAIFEAVSAKEGLIVGKQGRKSCFQRWNTKVQNNQVICANIDLIICVCSINSPPFRPHFVDRVLVCCKNVDILICLNKTDLKVNNIETEHLNLYKKLGFKTLEISVKTGKNINTLKEILKDKITAFIGQSGVGKSSLINRLIEESDYKKQRIGEMNHKYNRGNHTTNYSFMFECPQYSLIDTPGFREISVPHDDKLLVAKSFPEFLKFKCAFSSCLHTEELDCGVKDALSKGLINEDRYNSYIRILDSMDDRQPFWHRNTLKKELKNVKT